MTTNRTAAMIDDRPTRESLITTSRAMRAAYRAAKARDDRATMRHIAAQHDMILRQLRA